VPAPFLQQAGGCMANPQRFCDCLTGLAQATESWQPNRRQAV